MKMIGKCYLTHDIIISDLFLYRVNLLKAFQCIKLVYFVLCPIKQKLKKTFNYKITTFTGTITGTYVTMLKSKY